MRQPSHRNAAWHAGVGLAQAGYHAVLALAGLAAHAVPEPPLFGGLAAMMRWMPERLLGRRYRAALANLAILDLHGVDAMRQARRHVVLELLRDVRFRRWEIHDPLQWRRRIRATRWDDPHRLWLRASKGRRLIALLHTGDHRLAVAAVIERHTVPTHFYVPALCIKGDRMHTALKSLEQFGHQVEIGDPTDPRVVVTMHRRMAQGVTVIVFVDFPSVLGPMRFGEPFACQWPGRDARLALAPLELAHRAGVPALLAGHRLDQRGNGCLHLLHHADPRDAQATVPATMRHASDFIGEDPANWFFLDRADSHLHLRATTRGVVGG